jgi:cupin fold WbuC family metalloprotein
MKYTSVSEEVLFTTEALSRLAGRDVELLKSMAMKNVRQRIRLCAHPDVEDTLHEMIIVLSKGTYVRPHRHVGKSESFHIIEGRLKVLMFGEDGVIRSVLKMDEAGSGETFFYRLSESAYHTVIPQSPLVVFHEATNGPFSREDTVYATWAPEDNDHASVKDYMEKLAKLMFLRG